MSTISIRIVKSIARLMILNHKRDTVMKKIVLTLVCVICCTLWGYGQFAFGDKVAILKVEDTDGVLDRSGESMLKSAMMAAFSSLPNSNVFDLSGYSPKQGTTFRLSEIKEIGGRAFADMVLVPSVAKLEGSEIYLSAKVVNVKTGITEAEDNVKCNLRAEGTSQATVFKRGCETLAKNLSNKIHNNQMKTITYSEGKLYRNGIELSESEIKSFFDGDGLYGRERSYERWKEVERNLTRSSKKIVAGSIVTSLGLGMLAGGVIGLVKTTGWPDDDTYRALSIGGTVVGATATLIGPFIFIGAQSKKAGWKEMEDIFLERQSKYRAELNFGTQKYGVGFALKF